MTLRTLLSVLAAAAAAVAAPVRAQPPPPAAAAGPATSARSAADLSPHSLPAWKGDTAVTDLRRVPRGDHVRALPVAGKLLGEVRFVLNGKSWTLDEYMRAFNTSGILVMRDGQVLLERYGPGRDATDRWASMSVAKSVTSLLAGAAVGDGRLRLSDPVVNFVPELKGSAYDGVTVRQLLTMSSGVKWNEDYVDANSDMARYYAMAFAGGDPVVDYLKGLPRAHAPGTTWHYNTGETNLAGLVVSRAVGKPLSDYLSEKIWKPFGMERDAYWQLDTRSREVAGCCLFMTLRDYARVGQFALEDGVANGRRIEPPGWIADSTRVEIANDQPAPNGYGYFWWIGAKAYEASGIYGQSILVYPKERLVIAVNSAWPRPVGKDLFGPLFALQGAIHDAAAPDFPKVMSP